MRFIKWFLTIIIIQCSFLNACRCEKCSQNIPLKIQVPPLTKCNEHTIFEMKEKEDPDFEQHLQQHIKKYQNVGGSVFTFPDGSTKVIYRSSFLCETPDALQELIQERHVETVINLYNTHLFDINPWVEKEKALCESFGCKNYINITDFNYNFNNDEEKQKVMEKITEILSIIRSSQGNVLIHCMGGEHRSGIIFGVLRKCYHPVSMEAIIQEYKCHTGGTNEELQCGYNAKNVELIMDYPPND